MSLNTDLMFSSKTDLWYTPRDFYKKLNDIYNFTLDPCSDWKNNVCDLYYTEKEDWLVQDWKWRVFCNPPYWRWLKNWIKKASEEIKKDHCELIVMLIPARTDTTYFHQYIYKKENVEIDFLKWRLKFWWSRNSAPFPSMLVYFNKQDLWKQ